MLPSLDLTESNPVRDVVPPGPIGVVPAIVAGVVGTAFAGMVLSWLRNRSGSLAAPVMVHISSNSIGFVLAWFDFDKTHPAPWEWDVKRLCASMVIGPGRGSAPTPSSPRPRARRQPVRTARRA